MDIARPDLKQKKQRRLVIWGGVAAVIVAVAVVAVARLKPAAPTVDRSTIWTDTVKRGPMIRQVRASMGSLVPREDSIELIPAQTDATIVRIRVLPGTEVTPDTVLLDMADPQLQQQVLNAQLALKAAQADYKSLQATLQSTLMDKKTAAAEVNSNYSQDQLQAQTDKALFDLGVISGLAYTKSKNTADQLTTQHQLSQQQLEVNQKAIEVQLASAQTKVDQAKALLDLYEKQAQALEVRAGHIRDPRASDHSTASGRACDCRNLCSRGDPARQAQGRFEGCRDAGARHARLASRPQSTPIMALFRAGLQELIPQYRTERSRLT